MNYFSIAILKQLEAFTKHMPVKDLLNLKPVSGGFHKLSLWVDHTRGNISKNNANLLNGTYAALVPTT